MLEHDHRLTHLLNWLTYSGYTITDCTLASTDASFRRYFRVWNDGHSYIVMDAPPHQENVRPFLSIASIMRDAGVQTPRIYASDIYQGFVLLEDFGDTSYLSALKDTTVDTLYADACNTLLRLQTSINVHDINLPVYNEALLYRELELFREWYLSQLLGLTLSPSENSLLDTTWHYLIENALEQPKVCVHRDYHSRNLMVTEKNNPGVLDFQDAVIGPITYDLVSLFRDCYIDWPHEKIYKWVKEYENQLQEEGILNHLGILRFYKWFTLMGVQRHLKAIGIFSRLKLRDHKSGYLRDIPRTLRYVIEAGQNDPHLTTFVDFLETEVHPRFVNEV